jgi:uncharacterized protein (TIGR02001 family)
MRKNLLPLLALSILAVPCLRAQDASAPKSDWTITGNAGLFSDYRYRGFTQTAYKPSFQGGFDVAHRSGFYFGNWNANVEQALYRSASLEMDLYGGYKFAADPVNLDLGAITCRYPTRANTGSVGEVHHDEIYAGLSYGIVTAKFSYALSNYFGLGDGTAVDTKGNWYLDLGASYDLGNGWGLNARYGHQSIKNATDPAIGLKDKSVDDYKVGVTKDMNGWVASAAWFGTSKDSYFTTGISAPEAAGRGAVVVGLSKTF